MLWETELLLAFSILRKINEKKREKGELSVHGDQIMSGFGQVWLISRNFWLRGPYVIFTISLFLIKTVMEWELINAVVNMWPAYEIFDNSLHSIISSLKKLLLIDQSKAREQWLSGPLVPVDPSHQSFLCGFCPCFFHGTAGTSQVQLLCILQPPDQRCNLSSTDIHRSCHWLKRIP